MKELGAICLVLMHRFDTYLLERERVCWISSFPLIYKHFGIRIVQMVHPVHTYAAAC